MTTRIGARRWWRLAPALCLLGALGLSAQEASAVGLPHVFITVNTTADDPIADCTGTHACSLRGAVNKADSITPYSIVTITVPGSPQHYQVRQGELLLENNEIHIVGGGRTGTIIDAGGPAASMSTAAVSVPPGTIAQRAPSSGPAAPPARPAGGTSTASVHASASSGCGCRVFDVEGINAQFRGLTVTGGSLTVVQTNSYSPAPSAQGAGIYAPGGYYVNGQYTVPSQVLLQDVVLSNNQIRATCGPYYYYYNSQLYVTDGCGNYSGAGLYTGSNVDMIASEATHNSIVEDCTEYDYYNPYSGNGTSSCYGNGGGGALLGGNATVNTSLFDHNQVQIVCHYPQGQTVYGSPSCSGADGAGLENDATSNFTNDTFTCNTAGTLTDFCTNPGPVPPQQQNGCNGVNGGQGNGGGFSNYYDLTATGLTITKNTSLCYAGGAELGDVSWISTSQITHNVAGSTSLDLGTGGGLGTYNNVTLTGDTIEFNTTGYDGGGLENRSDLTVQGSTIANNAAGSVGGGISNWSRTYNYGANAQTGNASLIGVTVSGNCAGDGGAAAVHRCTNSGASGEGGGIFSNGNVVQTTGSTISGNTALTNGGGCGEGGGLALEPETHSSNYPTSGANAYQLTASTAVSGNSACNGGGIYDNAMPVALDASKVTGNSATADGGGIYLHGAGTTGTGTPAYLTIDHGATVSGNTAGVQTGGVWNDVLGAFLLAHGGAISGNSGGTCPQTTVPCQ